ncbi:MAG: bacterioferritin [Deltaproteobacteria bacterium]|nr:bacterioferritin [Deltaproteobacteria bacterium]
MQGDTKVIGFLNRYLRTELTGHKQYLLHSRRCAKWGYGKLAHKQLEYSHEESSHAAKLLDRILLLEGTPELEDLRAIAQKPSVEEQLRLDVDLVTSAIVLLREAILAARAALDDGTAALFEEMLVDEEHHLDFLEIQLSLIGQLGAAPYLQQQM